MTAEETAVQETGSPGTQGDLKAWGIDPEPKSEHCGEYETCPLCGDRVPALPVHLPECPYELLKDDDQGHGWSPGDQSDKNIEQASSNLHEFC